jgi:hypothetical protein
MTERPHEDPRRLARIIMRAAQDYARAVGASHAAALLAALAREHHLAAQPPPYRRRK